MDMKFCFFFILFISFNGSSFAQRLVEREIIINPIFTDLPDVQDGELLWMSSVTGWGSFGHYTSGDREHEWYQKMGISLELFRRGNHAGLSFVSNIEFIANDRNNIRFNPRALIWEEGFVYSRRFRKSFLQIGYFHRCKHDVENLSEGYERSLIFGGLLGKIILAVKEPAPYCWSYLALQANIYTILQDLRIPDAFNRFNPNLEQLLGTVAINFNNRKTLTKHFGIYINSYGSLNFFGRNKGFVDRFQKLQTINFNGGISTGVAIQGSIHFRIGLNFEYFSDTTIDPLPKHASLLTLGIFVINPKFML
jgi:hypothetical protein